MDIAAVTAELKALYEEITVKTIESKKTLAEPDASKQAAQSGNKL